MIYIKKTFTEYLQSINYLYVEIWPPDVGICGGDLPSEIAESKKQDPPQHW